MEFVLFCNICYLCMFLNVLGITLNECMPCLSSCLSDSEAKWAYLPGGESHHMLAAEQGVMK